MHIPAGWANKQLSRYGDTLPQGLIGSIGFEISW